MADAVGIEMIRSEEKVYFVRLIDLLTDLLLFRLTSFIANGKGKEDEEICCYKETTQPTKGH
jgi:hypothetical protein